MNYENNINEITENLIPDNNNNEIQLMPLESDKPSSIFLSKTFKISVIILLISVINNYYKFPFYAFRLHNFYYIMNLPS